MIDQTALSKGKKFAVLEDLSQGAAYKTKNEKDQFQRPVVTSRGAKSVKYKTTVTLTTCVHGYLDALATPAVPASLIVLEYSLNAISDEKYATAYTSLEFSKMDPAAAGKGPKIVAWSPHSSKAHLSKVDEVKTKDRRFEGVKIDAMGNGGEINGAWGTSTETTAEREYFQVIQSDKQQSGSSGTGCDGVWWSMRQNPDLKDGVPPTLKTAILVRRDVAAADAKFVGTFILNPHATKRHAFKDRWNNWWGVVEDDPILFDPTLPKLGGEGIPAGKLGELCVGEGYEDLRDLGYFKNLRVLIEPSSKLEEDGLKTAHYWISDFWVVSWVLIGAFVLFGLLDRIFF